jgi:hypothetical protein
MLRRMMKRTSSMLLVGLLMAGCSSDRASTFGAHLVTPHPDASENATSDASAQAATPTVPCPGPCPKTEPNEGDPCDLDQQCEYGDYNLVECNRLYFCSLGHFEKRKYDDMSVCATPLPSGCPPMHASATSGGACASDGLRCVYLEGECDCRRGAWHCFPDNPQLGLVHCSSPRPRIGSQCDTKTNVACQYEDICTAGTNCMQGCEAESCSRCNQWQMTPYRCADALPVDGGGGTGSGDGAAH